MIEISHKQVRHLLRESLDRPIPEEQWMALQSHLEGCAGCRAERARLSTLEKNLRRALRSGWDGVTGSHTDTGEMVVGRWRRKTAIRRRVFQSAMAAICVVVAVIFTRFARLQPAETGTSAERGPAPASAPYVTATPLPTVEPGQFGSIVAFSSDADGDKEIYLLNPGSVPDNLTDDPAQDTNPAWSPDGEWIAYLSDRTGKTEVFVMSIAGNRRFQLTDEPDIVWQGPLSWSPDGKWLALTGLRSNQGHQSWIYLVALDGSGPRAVAGTRGGSAPEFAAFGNRLAYTRVNQGKVSVVIKHVDTGERVVASWPDSGDSWLYQTGHSLDWSTDGSSLVYLGASREEAGEGGSQIVTMQSPSPSIDLFYDFQKSARVAQSRWPQAFRSVTWTSGGAVVYLEDLSDARANTLPGTTTGACWRLQMKQPGSRRSATQRLPAGHLCVESGLDRSSWTPDGRWLVVVGRQPGETRQSLYAVRMPVWSNGGRGANRDDDDGSMPGTVIELAGEQWSFGEPKVRPSRPPFAQPIAINPQPVLVDRTTVPLSNPREAQGELVYSMQNNAASLIVRASPDGTGGRVLTSSIGMNHCPRWSPDGKQVAFIASSGGDTGGGADLPGYGALAQGEEIFVVDENGQNLRQLSSARFIPGTGSSAAAETSTRYGCPSWSPDGRLVSAFVDTGSSHYLAILPLESGRAYFWEISTPAGGPVWTPDSSRVVLAHEVQGGRPPEVLAVNLSRITGRPVSEAVLRASNQWGSIGGLAVSPDGWQLVLLSSSILRDSRALAVLRRFSLHGTADRSPVPVGPGSLRVPMGQGSLAWLPDDGLGLVLHNSAEDRYKAVIQRYDLLQRRLETLTQVEDQLFSAAWSPDGRWVVYSTESGLWALDIERARIGQAAPVWISPQPVFDMDWR